MSANETAALIVAMSAQLTQFEKDMGRANDIADKGVKQIEDRFAKSNPSIAGAIDKMAEEAIKKAKDSGGIIGAVLSGSIVAAFIGAGAFGKHLIDVISEFGDKAADLHLPVNVLQAFSVAADNARVKTKELTDAMDHIADVSKKGEDDDDLKKLNKALEQISEKSVGLFKDAPSQAERIRVIMDTLKAATDPVEKLQLAQQALGTTNERVISIFDGGRGALDTYIEQLKALGLTIDEGAVKKAQEARSALSLLTRAMVDQVSSGLGGLIPAFREFLPLIEKVGAAFRDTIAGFASPENRPLSTLQNEFAGLQSRLVDLKKELETAPEEKSGLLKTLETIARSGPIDVGPSSTTRPELEAEIKQIEETILKYRALIAIKKNAEDDANKKAKDNEPKAFLGVPDIDVKDKKDAFDKSADSIRKHIAAVLADGLAVSQTAGEHARLRAELQLLQAAQKDDDDITDEMIEKYVKLRATMSAQQALTASGIKLEEDHAATFEKVAKRAADAAHTLDTTKRSFEAINEAAKFGGEQLVDVLDGLGSKIKSFSDLVQQLAPVIRRALLSALIVGEGPLAGILGSKSNISGGTGGLVGSILSLFGGGGLESKYGTPDKLFPDYPHNASGTDNWGGGATWVGENGPEVVNLPRGAQVIPNDVARRSGGGATQVNITNHVDATGADVAAVSRLTVALKQVNSSIEQRAVAALDNHRRMRA